MDRIKVVRAKNFTTIDNAIAKDKRASLRAKGLLLVVMSFPENWDFTVNGLAAVLKEKRGAVYSVITELIDLGYCTRKKRTSKGKFAGTDYTFYEVSENRVQDIGYGLSDAVNRTVINNREIKSPDVPTTAPVAYVRIGDTYVGTGDDFFANLEMAEPVDQDKGQQFLIPDVEPRERKVGPDIPEISFAEMFKLCYQAENVDQIKFLDSRQRGRVASVLGKLVEAGADLGFIQDFGAWWSGTWMSKDRVSGQYMPPRPEQVQEYWLTAVKYIQEKVQISMNGGNLGNAIPTQSGPTLEEFEAIMRRS